MYIYVYIYITLPQNYIETYCEHECILDEILMSVVLEIPWLRHLHAFIKAKNSTEMVVLLM